MTKRFDSERKNIAPSITLGTVVAGLLGYTALLNHQRPPAVEGKPPYVAPKNPGDKKHQDRLDDQRTAPSDQQPIRN